MKALIYKELKLAVHPLCYLFVFIFPFMILIPAYPLGIGFIYALVCYPILFLGANKGQQSNDLLYTALLPVRKKDIVLARVITVLLLQFGFMAVMSLLYPFALMGGTAAMDPAGSGTALPIPGLGLNSYVLVLAFAVVGYALADLIFFSIYYRKGKSIVLSSLLSIFFFVFFILFFTLILPLIPDFAVLNQLDLWIQFVVLAGALLISFGLHFLTYKVSANLLEKVDF